MTEYGAYTRVENPYPTLEEAIERTTADLTRRGLTPQLRAVSVVTQAGNYGAFGETAGGEPVGEAVDTQAIVVSVESVFKMDYILEFGEYIGEDGSSENDVDAGPAGSTTPEEPDGGTGEDQSESEAV